MSDQEVTSFSWEDAVALVDRTLPLFRENFERDGYLVPVVFMVVGIDPASMKLLSEPAVAVFPLPLDDSGPTFPVEALKKTAKMLDAQAYVLVAQLHGLEQSLDGELTGKARNFIMVTLEHKATGKLALWEAEVQPSVIVSLGEFELKSGAKVDTPLTGLLADDSIKMN